MRRLLLLAALSIATPAQTGEPPRAPAFAIRTVSGETFSLDAARAKGPVLIDFWATWCKPCVRALPEIQSLYARYAEEGLTVIGVSVDGPRNHAKVRPFASRFGLTYPIAVDVKGDVARDYRVTSVPTVVLVDSAGVVRLHETGYRPGDEIRMERRIRDALGLPPEAGG